MMKTVLALALLAVAAIAQEADDCPVPKPIPGFDYNKFTGQWFEIGAFRNAGPKIFNEDCFCSTSNVTKDELGEAAEDTIYSYDCNLEEATGDLQVYDTFLYGMEPAGKWNMDHLPALASPHALTVVSMADTHALVYRCGDYGAAGISYTAQILSRKNVLDEEIVNKMKKMVTDLKLNPENAEYRPISHDSCTYEGH